MDTKITISKFDAALDQLTSAIDLYFDNGKLVAVHGLAASAFQVFHDMSEDSPHKEFDLLERFLSSLPTEKQCMVRKILREPQNFIKHANRDKERKIILYECHTEYLLLCGVFLAEHFGIETSNQMTKDDRLTLAACKFWMLYKFLPESSDVNFQLGHIITIISGPCPFIPPLSPTCSRQEYYQWSKRVWGGFENKVQKLVAGNDIKSLAISLLNNPKNKEFAPLPTLLLPFFEDTPQDTD